MNESTASDLVVRELGTEKKVFLLPSRDLSQGVGTLAYQ